MCYKHELRSYSTVDEEADPLNIARRASVYYAVLGPFAVKPTYLLNVGVYRNLQDAHLPARTRCEETLEMLDDERDETRVSSLISHHAAWVDRHAALC